MHVLVTSGNTLVPIDGVRCITNIFTGKTGTRIALEAYNRGHRVTLLTSHPETVELVLQGHQQAPCDRWQVLTYRAFDDLRRGMQTQLVSGNVDALVHCAAVSDYLSAGLYLPQAGTEFAESTGEWQEDSGAAPRLDMQTERKVKSDAPEMWLRLVRAPKLVDLVRAEWNFRGVLVKFKLEAAKSDEELLTIAEDSRVHSSANLMVANTLEGSAEWAFVGAGAGGYQRVERSLLAGRLIDALEECHVGLASGRLVSSGEV